MAIIESNPVRIKITDSDGDSLIVHDVQYDGKVVVTCHDGDHDQYAACELTNEERIALIHRLGGEVRA